MFVVQSCCNLKFPFFPSQRGETPLFWASYRGHLAIVSVLLSNGANVNAQNKVCVMLPQRSIIVVSKDDGNLGLHIHSNIAM